MIKLLFLFLLPLFLLLKCKCLIDIEWKGKSIQCRMVVKIAGISFKRYLIPIELAREPEYKVNSKPKKLTKSDLQHLKDKVVQLRHKIFRLNSWLKGTLKGFKIETLNLSAGVGLDRPDLSAWLNGGIGILQALIVQQLSRYVTLAAPPRISLRPGFNQSPFTAAGYCIISVSMAHLIKAGIILLMRRMNSIKSGERFNWNIQSKV